MNATSEIRAALHAIQAVAAAMEELREVPSGHLYAGLCGRVTLVEYTWVIDRLVGAQLVDRRGDLLRWVGPGGKQL